ncbi:hypothetical protein [uncultured Draconibacterium sp.]|uniref:hypothetical protein n=1 Tax=uncultured Draconibacterium sp. TaxID=1573823 RepID=UPI003261AEAB
MKKLGFLIVFVALASFAFAQTSTVTQTNDLTNGGTSSVVATVTQTGGDNATVTQSSVGNTVNGAGNQVSAIVTQTNTGGNANTVTINQTAATTTAPDGSILKVSATQTGVENAITQTQADDPSNDKFVERDFMAKQNGELNTITQSSVDGDQGSVKFEATQDGYKNDAVQETKRDGGSTYDGANTPFATGKIMQIGDFNQARQVMKSLDAQGDIYQEGNSNIGEQIFGDNTKENHADIDQLGNFNEAKQKFTSGNSTAVSRLTAIQNGDGNYSEQTVTIGNDNIGNVTQTSPAGNLPMGNEAYQTFTGDLNLANIIQVGLNNTATQMVSGNDNEIDIEQEQVGATGNRATQTVNGDMNGQGDTWHNALIWQIGSNNEAIQNLDGYKNDVVIQQTWNSENNFAKQDITATSQNNNSNIWQVYGSVDNEAYQLVEGSFNSSHIEQWNGSSSSEAKQYIYGATSTLNSLNISQTGDDQIATQSVTGSYNSISVSQQGANNEATQTITGDYNTSTLRQNALSGAHAMLTQDGDGNSILLNQDEGSFSSATVLQEGDSNILQGVVAGDPALNNNGSTLLLNQLGSFNTANVEQTAFGAMSTITQNGNGNVSTVIQF